MSVDGGNENIYLECHGPYNSFAEAIGSAILNELEVANNTDTNAKTTDSMFRLETIDLSDLVDEHDNPIPECYILYTIGPGYKDWTKVCYINPIL